jgi:ADP-ribose pyrophosphatase YjhB (NUDIX family)
MYNKNVNEKKDMNGKLDKNGLTEAKFFEQYDDSIFYKPSLAIDSLIFTIAELPNNNIRKLSTKQLQVLLVKRIEHPFLDWWALPGVFLQKDETFKEAIKRCAKLKSNVDDMYLEQLYSFDALDRDPRTRVISIAYMGLININKLNYKEVNENAKWFTIQKDKIVGNDLIAFDNEEIIKYGLFRLRNKIEYADIAFSLLPDEFTIAELKQVYEVILDKKLSKANFQRKIKDKIECLNKYQKGGFRPALLYKYVKN